MSVVVRMEMPERCGACRCRHIEFDIDYVSVFCSLKDNEYVEDPDSRPSWCPIVCSLPEGHGRLIDADEFLKRAIGTKCFDEDDSRMLHGLVGESIAIVPAEK